MSLLCEVYPHVAYVYISFRQSIRSYHACSNEFFRFLPVKEMIKNESLPLMFNVKILALRVD